MKIKCSTCNELKDKDNFYESSHLNYFHKGYSVYCKECQYISQRSKRTPLKGYIYIITNPAWPDYVKIGSAKNIGRRIDSYNTGSPLRDYQVYYLEKSNDIHLIEYLFKESCNLRDFEWYKISPDIAKEMLINIIKEHQ